MKEDIDWIRAQVARAHEVGVKRASMHFMEDVGEKLNRLLRLHAGHYLRIVDSEEGDVFVPTIRAETESRGVVHFENLTPEQISQWVIRAPVEAHLVLRSILMDADEDFVFSIYTRDPFQELFTSPIQASYVFGGPGPGHRIEEGHPLVVDPGFVTQKNTDLILQVVNRGLPNNVYVELQLQEIPTKETRS